MFIKRANQVFALGGSKISIAPEFTYSLLALVAAFLSFILVKPNMNFGFYFFVMTRTASNDGKNKYFEAQSKGHRFSFG